MDHKELRCSKEAREIHGPEIRFHRIPQPVVKGVTFHHIQEVYMVSPLGRAQSNPTIPVSDIRDARHAADIGSIAIWIDIS
jgi:hypothetical protein